MSTQPTREFLLKVLEEDMFAHHRPFANLAASHIYPEPDCFFYTSNINFGAFGGILAQRFNGENVDQRIQELNKEIANCGRDIGWILSPLATPSGIQQKLAESGARKVVDLKGMVLDMKDLPAAPDIPNLTIRKVEDEASLIDYARIYPLLFHQPVEDWIDDLVAAELEIFRNNGASWNRWVAYEGEKPVAAGRTGQVLGVASLQILCTLPDHRNKGIGQALATWGLRHENKDFAVVWAGPDADRLYSRMGYREICTTSVYDLPN